ncbi:MAG: HD domain-containing protein [Alphaproteobacteria bacterium]|nr:HD domain-containing protein [Alphaproteobacteria bacterium]
MTDINEVIKVIGEVKSLRRSGWIKRNVSLPESDADHQWGVAFLALLYADEALDKLKCLKLALVHDIQECICGDFTLVDEITPEQKHQLELAAITEIARRLNFPELADLFDEFEEQKTAEAKFVKGLDKLETVCQAQYYDNHKQAPAPLIPEFKSYAERTVKDETAKRLLSEIV